MNKWRLAAVESLFQSLVELPPKDRERLLDEHCGSDEELRSLIERMLANHDGGMGDFLESPELSALETLPSSPLVEEERSPAFPRGSRVAERYRVERLLGRGGMGEVYATWDEELSILVALKTLGFEAGTERDALRRLKQEAMLARSIVHPNVCRVYDLSRHRQGELETWFLTMEILAGGTLKERLLHQGRFTTAEALPLVEQMAAGLNAAHEAGVLHGDFKSSNVMIRSAAEGEQAVITDFGLARTRDDVRWRAGEPAREPAPIAGTPAYMAPELFRGEKSGPAADVYALGVVLYEMVTGGLPFKGRTPWDRAVRRPVEVPLSPRIAAPDLDDRWEEVILRCLAQEPRARFAHPMEVADGLAGRSRPKSLGAATVSAASDTLPAEHDAFIGREVELADLGQRFARGSRVVTILGAAGMGKTRVAVRYARHEREKWPGGAWFCDLTEAKSQNGVLTAVARSLSVQLGGGDPIAQLGHAIAGRGQCLIILDNCEQVARYAAKTLGRWLQRAEVASFLVTSREPLGLPGEEVQRIEPLGLESGLALFVERAQRLRPGFRIAGDELAAAEEVVRLLEGMPLAIELAAARMRVMSARELVGAMRKRFHLLTGGPSSRHETLAATIDGSWMLLSPWEKSAFAQCSVFEGGFTLQAAEEVIDLGSWPEAPWMVDVLQSLVDKNLLRVQRHAAKGRAARGETEARFRMYASLQEYARGRLGEEGAIAAGGSGPLAMRAVEERHGRWYGGYGADEVLAPLRLRNGSRLVAELENLVTACRRAVDRADAETAAGAYAAAEAGFELQGPNAAAVGLGQELAAVPFGAAQRARYLTALGRAQAISALLDDARLTFQAALDIRRERGEKHLETIPLAGIGNVLGSQGRYEEARDCFQAALAIDRGTGTRILEGALLSNLATILVKQGRLEDATPLFEEAIAMECEVGNRSGEGNARSNLGYVLRAQGQMDAARSQFELAVELARESGDRRDEGSFLNNLGSLHQLQGRMEDARVSYERALLIHREVGNRRSEAIVRGNLGSLCREQGRFEDARSHLEGALVAHREVGNGAHESVVLRHLGDLECDQGQLDEARAYYETALALSHGLIERGEVNERGGEGIIHARLGKLHRVAGRKKEALDALTRGESILRQVADRVELGKLLSTRALMECEAGDHSQAAATLSEAEALARQVGAGHGSELGRMLSAVGEIMR